MFNVCGLLAPNVHRLGEGREIELRLPTLAPKMIKDKKFSPCYSALLLPNRMLPAGVCSINRD
jgi:hypothetical protein